MRFHKRIRHIKSVKCYYLDCANNRLNSPNTSMFKIPEDSERCKIWLSFMGRLDLMSKPSSKLHDTVRVCADHFEEKYFTSTLRTRLQPFAQPLPVRSTSKTTATMHVIRSTTSMPMSHHYSCDQWVLRCNRSDLDNIYKKEGPSPHFCRTYKICSDHFLNSDFRNPRQYSQGLKPGTVPTLKLPSENTTVVTSRSHLCKRKRTVEDSTKVAVATDVPWYARCQDLGNELNGKDTHERNIHREIKEELYVSDIGLNNSGDLSCSDPSRNMQNDEFCNHQIKIKEEPISLESEYHSETIIVSQLPVVEKIEDGTDDDLYSPESPRLYTEGVSIGKSDIFTEEVLGKESSFSLEEGCPEHQAAGKFKSQENDTIEISSMVETVYSEQCDVGKVESTICGLKQNNLGEQNHKHKLNIYKKCAHSLVLPNVR